VLETKRPFLVNLTHGGRLENLDEPFKTLTAAHRGEKALVAPSLIQMGYGEREGQKPRVLDLQAPLGTIVAGGPKHGLVAAFLAKHYGGHESPGSDLSASMGTITAKDHHALAAVHLTKFYGTNKSGAPIDVPGGTITASAGGGHFGLGAIHLGLGCQHFAGTRADLDARQVGLGRIHAGLRHCDLVIALWAAQLADVGLRAGQLRLGRRQLVGGNPGCDAIKVGLRGHDLLQIAERLLHATGHPSRTVNRAMSRFRSA